MTEHAAGTPIWVDFASSDLPKATQFYSDLFGWTANVGGEEVGNYTIFTKDGKMVAGGGPVMAPEQPSVWSTYMKTDDVDATVEAVKAAGGNLIFGPLEVMDQGKMAVFQDPTAGFFSVWQPLKHPGAEVFNEVGALSWNEYYTRDVPTAVEFYTKVFGWTVEETDMGNGKYQLFKIADRPVAGGMDMTPLDIPAHIPAHWLPYFTVANTNEAVEKAKQLGGSLAAGPMETPMGPFAVIFDPAGAVFAVIQFSNPQG